MERDWESLNEPQWFTACASSGCIRFIDRGDDVAIYSSLVGTIPFVTATGQEFLDMYDAIRSDEPNPLHDLAQRLRERHAAKDVEIAEQMLPANAEFPPGNGITLSAYDQWGR